MLVTQSCPILCDPMDCSPLGSLSMEFSRQESWSGLPFPSLGDLPGPGIEPGSPILKAGSLLSELPGKLGKGYLPVEEGSLFWPPRLTAGTGLTS